jgi:hypothetical protein
MRWAMVGWLAVWLVFTVVVIILGFVFHQW